MRIVGIDLAWGQRARTGIAEADQSGRLLRSASLRTDDEIAAFIGAGGAGPVVAGIDAPIVVVNQAGQRACEQQVGRMFGAYGATAYPANLGNALFRPESRALRLARRLGWALDPTAAGARGSSIALEVYPHAAMVALLGLASVIPYKNKKGRTVTSRQVAFAHLFHRLEEHLDPVMGLSANERWRWLRRSAESAARQVDLDLVEDEVDAVVCAHVAWMWAVQPDRMVLLGDAETGFIVTPALVPASGLSPAVAGEVRHDAADWHP